MYPVRKKFWMYGEVNHSYLLLDKAPLSIDIYIYTLYTLYKKKKKLTSVMSL